MGAYEEPIFWRKECQVKPELKANVRSDFFLLPMILISKS